MLPELEKIGFTRNEANVYLAALKTGAASVQQLANATGLNRITVHSIVEKFERMQIIQDRYEGKRRKIVAVEPTRIAYLLEEEAESLRDKKRLLGDIMPSLEELFRKTQRGLQVRTFKGEKGYEEMCEDVLREQKPMLEYANIDLLQQAIGPYLAVDYLPRKHALKIPTKFLFLDTPGAREYIRKNYAQNPGAAPMEAKFISRNTFDMDAFFVIYGNKLSILTPSTLDGVIIEDENVSSALLPFFEFVWNSAGESIRNN